MPKKTISTPIQKVLAKIRPVWITRVGHELARGMEVRAGFEEQLARFFDLLDQSITTGDPAWMDSILLDWAKSSTETELEDEPYQVSFLINRLIALTIQIARETLTKQMARVDRSKSAFISVAAHELKTPITLIEGYASMMVDLLQQGQGANLESLLAGMSTGIDRLRGIVEDMIDVSMIDNNLLQLNFQPMQVAQMLEALYLEVEPILSVRKLTLNIKEFDGNREWIYIDAGRIMQAVRNVINNAIKFTPDGGTITIDGRTLAGFIEVTISDTGIGISAEDQAAIFEKFDQLGRVDLHSSGKTKFKGGGPGLGLPIARGILDAHGGSIWVESEGYDEIRHPGSTFHILIPARTEAPDPKMTKLFDTLGKNKNEEMAE